MRTRSFTLVFVFALFAAITTAFAQVNADKVVVVNGGRFEFAPPFQDQVTVGIYDQTTGNYTQIDTIVDESVQHVVTYGQAGLHRAYVLTQTKLTVYDLTNNTRLVQRRALAGGAKMVLTGGASGPGKLVVTRGFGTPAGDPRILILDPNSLNTLGSVTGIGGECSHAVSLGQKVFVSVPFGFMSDTGSIAVVNLNTNSLERMVHLGTDGKGIQNLYALPNNDLMAIISNGFSSRNGTLAVFDTTFTASAFLPQGKRVSSGLGILGNRLYATFSNNSGFGSFSLSNNTLDTVLVPRSYAAGTVDTVNNRILITDPNYSSPGAIRVYGPQGNLIDTAMIGVSPEGIAVAYRATTTSLSDQDNLGRAQLSAYPNPANNKLYVKLGSENLNSTRNGAEYSKTLTVRNSLGQVVLEHSLDLGQTVLVNTESWASGSYFLTIPGAPAQKILVVR